MYNATFFIFAQAHAIITRAQDLLILYSEAAAHLHGVPVFSTLPLGFVDKKDICRHTYGKKKKRNIFFII
jgi:hypothetical protein